jgi:hypothetical protein
MTTPARAHYAGYRFPAEIIGHASVHASSIQRFGDAAERCNAGGPDLADNR